MADNNSRTLTANFTADTSAFSPKINELVQKLKSASQEFEQNKTKISALKTEMKTYQKELQNLAQKQQNGNTLTAEEKQRMQELRDKIAACATQLGTFNSAQRQLSANMNSLNRQLSEARDEFNGTGRAAATFGDILKANIASDVVMSGIRKIVDGLRQAAAYCYDVGSKFEAGMSKVAAVSGASAGDLERLTEKAKDLGASTKFTASETAEAMNYMAMAGWKTEEMLSGIDGVLGLAAASGSDLATTSDIVTDAITAFGLKADDCAHFADILAAASSNANTNVALMGETFKYCAADAGSLGFSAEDTVTAIGLMASAGIKGSQAGTALRKLFTEMSGDLTLTSEKMGDITVQTATASGEMRPFIDIVKELRSEFAKLNPQEQTAAAKNLVGQYAQTGFKTLMNASEQDFQKLTGAIQNCDGAAANMAETMEQNVSGAVTKMNSALEGVGIAVYDKFKGGLLDAVNIFTETLSDLKTDIDGGELDESVGNLAESFKHLATETANFAKNNLSSFINGLANGLNFVIKFRTEIGSAIKMFITFKGAMKIGSVVTELVGAVKSFTTATQAANSAQATFNATAKANPYVTIIAAGLAFAVGELSEFIGHTKRATESVEELRQKSEELSQSAADYKKKAGDLSDIKKQYEEIYNAVDPDVKKSDELKNLQDQLISQFPELAGKIDLVGDAYDNTCGKLQKYIDKTTSAYKISAEGSLNSAKKKERDFATVVDFPDATDFFGEFRGDVERYAEELKTYKLTDAGFEFSGSYGDRLADMKALYEYLKNNFGEAAENSDFMIGLSQKIGEVGELQTQLEAAKADYDELENAKDKDDYGSAGTWRNKEYAEKYQRDVAEQKKDEERRKKELEENKKKYDEDKQLADDRYSVGEISAEEYYNKLTELRDTYLEKGTHDWYEATAKINSINGKSAKQFTQQTASEYDEQKQLIDDQYSVREISAEEYYKKLTELRDTYLEKGTHDWYSATAKIQSVYENMTKKTAEAQSSALSDTERAYKKTLDAIDAEIERHNREKSDKEYEKKLADIDNQMKFGRLDEFSKYELEKERKRLQEEREEELFSRNSEDAKASVTGAYDAKQALDKAAEGTKEYTMALGDYTDALENLSGILKGVSAAFSANPNSSGSTAASTDNSIKNQYVNVVLEAVNKSNGQLVDELIKALSSRL